MDPQGKTALVTGAARRLGRAIALALADCGADVVVHYGRSAGEAEEAAEEIRSRGVRAEALGADLARPEEIASLFERAGERFGGLDILVNSAASFRRTPFDAISAEEWDAVQAVNLRAPFLCIQAAARLMRAGRGAIVNIADLSGLRPWKGYAHHGVSKAGLIHLTRTAARELAPDLRVNCVVPGPVLPPPGVAEDDPAWERRGEGVPLGRTGRASDVAAAVLSFIHNDFVTGAVLPVDGGEHLIGAGPMEGPS